MLLESHAVTLTYIVLFSFYLFFLLTFVFLGKIRMRVLNHFINAISKFEGNELCYIVKNDNHFAFNLSDNKKN